MHGGIGQHCQRHCRVYLGEETYLIGLNPPGGGMSCIGVPPNGVAMCFGNQKVPGVSVSFSSHYISWCSSG